MHYHTEIWVAKLEEDVEEQIAKILAPYWIELEIEELEEDGDTYWNNPDGFWDWYEIGGRWAGIHYSNFPNQNTFDDILNKNITVISKVENDVTCHTLIIEDQVFSQDWNFNGNVFEKLNELGITDGYLITVDYHC